MSLQEFSRRTGIPFQSVRRNVLVLIDLLTESEKSEFVENYEQ